MLEKLNIKEKEVNDSEIAPTNKYDVIIIDEAQDFNEEEAFFLRNLTLSESSEFYVFYDNEQNIYNNELDKTLDNFLIEKPPYVLTENLRAMEELKIASRRVYPEVPPRVEYSLTELGESLKPILESMYVWGENYKANYIKKDSKYDSTVMKK